MQADRLKNVTKQTNNPFLNMYQFDVEFRNGKISPYYVASRSPNVESLEAVTHAHHSDAIIIYAIYGEQKDKIVLVRQFRYPVNGYTYELPAGLVEKGEDMYSAGIRELYEETGLTFNPKKVDNAYTRPFFSTPGLSDESAGAIYGYCTGTPSNSNQEESEDIQIILADKNECKRILKEENVPIMCAYHLMHFIHNKDDDPLDFLDEISI